MRILTAIEANPPRNGDSPLPSSLAPPACVPTRTLRGNRNFSNHVSFIILLLMPLLPPSARAHSPHVSTPPPPGGPIIPSPRWGLNKGGGVPPRPPSYSDQRTRPPPTRVRNGTIPPTPSLSETATPPDPHPTIPIIPSPPLSHPHPPPPSDPPGPSVGIGVAYKVDVPVLRAAFGPLAPRGNRTLNSPHSLPCVDFGGCICANNTSF